MVPQDCHTGAQDHQPLAEAGQGIPCSRKWPIIVHTNWSPPNTSLVSNPSPTANGTPAYLTHLSCKSWVCHRCSSRSHPEVNCSWNFSPCSTLSLTLVPPVSASSRTPLFPGSPEAECCGRVPSAPKRLKEGERHQQGPMSGLGGASPPLPSAPRLTNGQASRTVN